MHLKSFLFRLFLHDDDNGDADDEDDSDLYVTSSAFHRPDWAKARMRVANAEEIGMHIILWPVHDFL